MKFKSLKFVPPPMTGYYRTGPAWSEWGHRPELEWDWCQMVRVGHFGVFEGMLKAPILNVPSIEAQWLSETVRLKTQWWQEEGRMTRRGFQIIQESSWGLEKGFQKIEVGDLKMGLRVEERARLVEGSRLRLDVEMAYLARHQERVWVKWSQHWLTSELPEGMAKPGALEDDGFNPPP